MMSWFFLIFALFWLSETGQVWGFQEFPGDPLRKWPETLHADVSWSYSELIRIWEQLIFQILVLFWLRELGQIWGFWAFWSCSVDLLCFGASLTETGHIWGCWTLSGECVGVNVKRGRRHISDTLCRVLPYVVRYWDSWAGEDGKLTLFNAVYHVMIKCGYSLLIKQFRD